MFKQEGKEMSKESFENRLFNMISEVRDNEYKIILVNAQESRFYKFLINSFQKKLRLEMKYPKLYLESAVLEVPFLEDISMIGKQIGVEYIVGLMRRFKVNLPLYINPVRFTHNVFSVKMSELSKNGEQVREPTAEEIASSLDIEINYLKENIAKNFEDCLLIVGFAELVGQHFVSSNSIILNILNKLMELSKNYVVVLEDPSAKAMDPLFHFLDKFDASKDLLYNLYTYNSYEINKRADSRFKSQIEKIVNIATKICVEDPRIVNVQQNETKNPYTLEIDERKEIIEFVKKKSKKVRTKAHKVYLDMGKAFISEKKQKQLDEFDRAVKENMRRLKRS